MKRIFCLILSIVMIMAFITGCASSADTETPEKSGSSDRTDTAEEAGGSVSGSTVKLSKYKGLTTDLAVGEVTDDMVEQQIYSYLESDVSYEEVDRPAQLGDTVNIDYVGKIDGTAFEGGTAAGTDLELGSGSFIPGFEDAIVGFKKGDRKDINVTFPESYQSEELEGKDAVFSITVNAVKEKKTPELNDEWVTGYTSGTCKSVDEYKKTVRADLEKAMELDANANAQSDLITQIIENSEFYISDEEINEEAEAYKKAFEQYAQAYGMSLEDIYEQSGMTEESAMEEYRSHAIDSLKQKLVIDAIMEKEGMEIEASDEEYLADLYGVDTDTIKNLFGDNYEDAVKANKVGKFLYDNANVGK